MASAEEMRVLRYKALLTSTIFSSMIFNAIIFLIGLVTLRPHRHEEFGSVVRVVGFLAVEEVLA